MYVQIALYNITLKPVEQTSRLLEIKRQNWSRILNLYSSEFLYGEPETYTKESSIYISGSYLIRFKNTSQGFKIYWIGFCKIEILTKQINQEIKFNSLCNY